MCLALSAETNACNRRRSALPYANHNPNFFFDLDATPLSAEVNTVAALALLTLPTAAAR